MDCPHDPSRRAFAGRLLLGSTGLGCTAAWTGGCGGGQGAAVSAATPDAAGGKAVTVRVVEPAGGARGTTVLIGGDGFDRNISVTIGGADAIVEASTTDWVRAKVPQAATLGPVDVIVSRQGQSSRLQGGFWVTASGLPGNDARVVGAGVPVPLRNQLVHEPELVKPEYGYQPWIVMVAPRGSRDAVAWVDWFELVVQMPDLGGERLVTRDDFGIESPMRSGAWGELLWREPWGRSSGHRHEHMALVPASSPSMLELDQRRAPAGLTDALIFHSWTRDWELDPHTGANVGRARIAFALPPGSRLVLRASYKTRGQALLQIGLDRYLTRAGSELVEVGFSDYHVNEQDDWQTLTLSIAARS